MGAQSTMRNVDEVAMRLRKLARRRSHVSFTDARQDGLMRVLVVEDDRRLADLVRRGLTESGMGVTVVHRGDAALEELDETVVDCVVLDVMLPGLDGFAVCAALRARRDWTPILILTARDSVEDRVRGLDGGADDYLPKPFSLDELAARLRALARRGPVERPVVLEAGDLRLDPSTHRAWRGDEQLELSTTERSLLEVLLRHRGQILDREQLHEQAWGRRDDRRSNVVDVYIRYLRDKIDRPFGLDSIETIRGTGYRLRSDGGRPAAGRTS
jgi:two-component system OmpR family response regulator